jgi:hypothetical protein
MAPPFSRVRAAAFAAIAVFCTVPAAALAASGGSTAPPEGMLVLPARQAPENRGVEVDAEAIRDDQTRIIREENAGAGDALYTGDNGFTETIDRWHANAFRWLDDAIRAIDLRFASSGTAYEHGISSYSVSFLGRVGGRGHDGKSGAKARFRAALALPGLERRVHLVVDNAGRDELPDDDPMNRESDLRVGIQSAWKSRWKLGGGARWRHSRPVGYVDLERPWSHALAGGTFAFVPRGVWYTDEGFGQNAAVSWTSDRTRHTIWQFVTAESTRESFSGFHLEETVRVAFPHHSKGCGWILQASAFPHAKDRGRTFFDDWIVNATWRDALYRKWMYYTVTPQLDFAEEDDHEAKPSLRIGVEILFGRETRDLI